MVMDPEHPCVHESHGGHLLGGQGKANQTSSVQPRNVGLRRTSDVSGSEMSFVPFFSL